MKRRSLSKDDEVCSEVVVQRVASWPASDAVKGSHVTVFKKCRVGLSRLSKELRL